MDACSSEDEGKEDETTEARTMAPRAVLASHTSENMTNTSLAAPESKSIAECKRTAFLHVNLNRTFYELYRFKRTLL